MTRARGTVLIVAGAACAAAQAAPRDIQFRGMNLATGVVEVHNFGVVAVALDDWRFCTQDTNEILNYSAPNGLDGVSIAAGGSLFIHFNNDAPAAADHLNVSAIGGFYAQPLNSPAYSLAIYFPPVFFNIGQQMADYAQWSVGGANDLTADERADEAVAGGVWVMMVDWIPTSGSGTDYIRLLDTSGGELHMSTNYAVLASMPDCNSNGLDDVFEIQDGLLADADGNMIPDACQACSLADITTAGAGSGDPGYGVPDGAVTAADLNFYVNAYVAADASIADVTTTGAGIGDPGYGVPDGSVTAGDIQFFVNAWVLGCP